MYQALYRKYRPNTFDTVIGQPQVTEVLKNQVATGKFSHAYLFVGTRGTGKTTCARILAKAINCENPINGNPCCKCPSCLGIDDGSILDIVEMDAASNSKVEDVRALRDEVIYTPARLKKRVYIIDEVHMLSNSAFNALLKILEEPPEHLVFILATTELRKVPATIISRCQRHSFKRIDTVTISGHLQNIAAKEGIALTEEASLLLANYADGGFRDALSLLDQCSSGGNIDARKVYDTLGLAGKENICSLLGCILKHDTAAALQKFYTLWLDGKSPAGILNDLAALLRDIMVLKIAPKGGLNAILGGYSPKELLAFSGELTNEEIIAAVNTVYKSLGTMKDVKNPKTAAELCIVSLSKSLAADTTDDLRARISRLEEKLDGVECVHAGFSDKENTAAESAAAAEEVSAPEAEAAYESSDSADDLPLDDGTEDIPAVEPENEKEPGPEETTVAAEKAAPAEENAGKPVSPAEPSGWDGLFKDIESVLPPYAAPLWNAGSVKGELTGNTLKITVSDKLTESLLLRKDVCGIIEKTVSEREGQPMLVNIILNEKPVAPEKKRDINELRAFGAKFV